MHERNATAAVVVLVLVIVVAFCWQEADRDGRYPMGNDSETSQKLRRNILEERKFSFAGKLFFLECVYRSILMRSTWFMIPPRV